MTFDLQEALGDVERLLRHSATERGIALEFDYPQDAPRQFRGDPARIRQIAFHLVGNAVKFTENGSVRISCRVSESGEGPNVRIAVADTGIGIPANRLRAILAGFEQVDNSTTRKHEGLGLGLAITSRLASLMGGGLDVQSKEGKGSTFTVSLVLSPAETPKASGSGPEEESLRFGFRGLVVEDNKINQFVMRQLLGMIGIEADIASNGAEALEMLDREVYDLVFMDVRMPIMNGYEATKRIRARNDGRRRIPIIAVTADATSCVEQRCLEVGMDVFLAKPLTVAKLVAAIESLAELPRPAACIPG